MRTDSGTVSGRLLGVDDDGALVLGVDGGTRRRVVAGDLTRGPQRAVLGKHQTSRPDPARTSGLVNERRGCTTRGTLSIPRVASAPRYG